MRVKGPVEFNLETVADTAKAMGLPEIKTQTKPRVRVKMGRCFVAGLQPNKSACMSGKLRCQTQGCYRKRQYGG